MSVQKHYKKKATNWLLNLFAITFALFPIVSVSVWINQVFNSDPRKVIQLEATPATTPMLFQEPLVSVTFDDGWESIYTNGAPLLDTYDIASTQYIVPGVYDDLNYISRAQADSFRKAGHEIASHTWTHENLAKITTEEARLQLTKARDGLKDITPAHKKMSFASPESSTKPSVMPIIRELYDSHRNTFADFSNDITEVDINTAGHFDRYNIIGFAVRPTTPDAEIQAALDYAKANKGWLVLAYHQIDESGEAFSSSPAQLERHLKLIKQSHIKTAPVGTVMDSYKEPR